MTSSDRELIVRIVSHAFEQNPRIQVMSKRNRVERCVRLMTEYAVRLLGKLDGIYLSKDKSTVLFYWQKSLYRRDLSDKLHFLWMSVRAIRIGQWLPTSRREKFIDNLRPPYKDYIYVWILASDPKGNSVRGLTDIRNHLFSLSEERGLPILIETTVEKLLKLYHYVGFSTYHEWLDEKAGIRVWFLERKGKSGRKAPEKAQRLAASQDPTSEVL
ncbi:MAG: hypothetical protein R2751_09040 [Bacteroidales bacterium]